MTVNHIPIPVSWATSACEVICSFNQIGANTYDSIGKWVGVNPDFFKLEDENEIVSASRIPENSDSC